MPGRDDYVLTLSTGRYFKLVLGQALSQADLLGLQPARSGDSIVATVSQNPNDPSLRGLTNLSATAWSVEIPGKGPISVPPKKTVRLEHGVRINFGSSTAVIEDELLRGTALVAPGWRLRVTRGPLAGLEHPLPGGAHRLGRGPGATIVIPDPSLEPEHLALRVTDNFIEVRNLARVSDLYVGGRAVGHGCLDSGSEFETSALAFKVVNAAQEGRATASASWTRWMPTYVKVGLTTSLLAGLLFVLLALAPFYTLVPVTLFTMSAVIPATVMCYLDEKHNRGTVSYRTLGGTFLLGGTLGIVSTFLVQIPTAIFMGIGALAPLFAALFEEPAKLIATSWRWRHPAYDKPMDGLMIGTMSGFGFAVFETAGYGFASLMEGGGLAGLFAIQVLRGVLAPFGHGLWSGIVCAAFWECNRRVFWALFDLRFLQALATAIFLHGLWNSGSLDGWSLPLSAVLSVIIYRRRLASRGYSR